MAAAAAATLSLWPFDEPKTSGLKVKEQAFAFCFRFFLLGVSVHQEIVMTVPKILLCMDIIGSVIRHDMTRTNEMIYTNDSMNE